MKVIRWPELDVIESNGKIVDEFYTSTEKGPILTGKLFPEWKLPHLQDLKAAIEKKKKELNELEGQIYLIRNMER